MRISAEIDAKIRSQLHREYTRAQDVLALGARAESGGVWRVDPVAQAAHDPSVRTGMFAFLTAELAGVGLNLPLTQARSLLDDAAATFRVIGSVTVERDPAVRFAALAPLARSVTERASTVVWVLTAGAPEHRLQRSLLVEIRGLEFLLAYLPHVRTDRDASDLESARKRFLEIARTEAGGYTLDKKGSLLTVGSERRPSLTALVSEATTPYVYAELSVHAHPTGYLHVASTERSSGDHGQVIFERKSTVHDEGRLCEGAVLSFGRALDAVADYIGADRGLAYQWVTGVVDLWREWCREEGCV